MMIMIMIIINHARNLLILIKCMIILSFFFFYIQIIKYVQILYNLKFSLTTCLYNVRSVAYNYQHYLVSKLNCKVYLWKYIWYVTRCLDSNRNAAVELIGKSQYETLGNSILYMKYSWKKTKLYSNLIFSFVTLKIKKFF